AKGFVVASNQLSLTPLAPPFDMHASVPFGENERQFNIQVNGITVSISKSNGALVSYKKGNTELLGQPLLPHFTRPQTDNDRRGWKTHRVLKQWYDNAPQLQSVTPAEIDGLKGIESTYSLIHDSATVKVFYAVNKDGMLKVQYALSVKPGLPNIPKVGMQTGINRAFTQVSYFGRGPLENYIDRNYGFDAGVYQSGIYDFMEP